LDKLQQKHTFNLGPENQQRTGHANQKSQLANVHKHELEAITALPV